MQHVVAHGAAPAGQHVAHRVVADMPHVDAARRVREHLEHVVFRTRIVVLRREDVALVPNSLPARFRLARVVTIAHHRVSFRGPKRPPTGVTKGAPGQRFRLFLRGVGRFHGRAAWSSALWFCRVSATREIARVIDEGEEMNVSEQTASAAQLAAVKQTIEKAAREAQRDPASIELVAVSKTFGADEIWPVIAAGQRVFGENRVQEAKAKWPELKEREPGSRAASHRSAAVEQGARGGGAVRCDRNRGSGEPLRRPRQGNRACRQARRG